MTIKRIIIAVTAAVGLVIGAGLTAAPAASAAPVKIYQATAKAATLDPHEVCNVNSNGGAVECINNWNGAYGNVKSYAPGVANNNFVVEGVDRCGNGDKTTPGCPLAGVPGGLYVYQIAYGNNTSDCVATNGAGYAIAGKCNGNNGYGGSNGTLEIAFNPFDICPSGDNEAINVYWTGRYGGWDLGPWGIYWTEGNGNQVILNNGLQYCLAYLPF